VAGAGLDADLGDARDAGTRAPLELGVIALEIRAQLFFGRVLLADLADLAADADDQIRRLELADERGDLRRALVVGALLSSTVGWARSTRVEESTSMLP